MSRERQGLLLALVVFAASPAWAQSDRSDAVRLGAREIAALLRDTEMSSPQMRPPLVYDANHAERFWPDGVWQARGGRASGSGTYRLVGAQLCVQILTKERCR